LNRSTAAFLIALLFHLLLILLYLFFIRHIPKTHYKAPKEQKIKISLQQYHPPKPLKKNNFGQVKKKLPPPPPIAPPMPKGSQLKKLVKPIHKVHIQKHTLKKVAHIQPKEPPKVQKKPHATIIKKVIHTKSELQIASNRKTLPHPKENNTTKHAKLYSWLATPDKNKQNTQNSDSDNSGTRISQNVKELYGETFGKLSAGEQKYILNNAEIMRRITQQVLNRVGSVNISNDLHVTTYNVVQFYLHPNGDMTGFKFLKKSNYYILDTTTKETIEYAYSKYPKPKQTTLIRYRVNYLLGGN
jgi:periplasmic protein TonB